MAILHAGDTIILTPQWHFSENTDLKKSGQNALVLCNG